MSPRALLSIAGLPVPAPGTPIIKVAEDKIIVSEPGSSATVGKTVLS